MKLKWRQHEIALITSVGIMMLAGHLWNILHLSTEVINMSYAGPFNDLKVPFSLTRNVIIPYIAIYLLIYISYLWINIYIIPALLSRKYKWFFIQLFSVVIVSSFAFSVIIHFKNEWQFYQTGSHPFTGFSDACGLFLLYGLYAAARELVIYVIERSTQREFNIMICNKITSFLLQLICLLVFLKVFGIVDEGPFFVRYSWLIVGLFVMFISNVYWIFPLKGDDSFLSKKVIIRLLPTSAICAIPFTFFIHEGIVVSFLYGWVLNLFAVTSASWLYYQLNKERILQLRVVEKELVKSKADLQFLRSQINPHFLFNALNTLYGTALQENAGRTSEGIQKLGDMMRFMLHENNRDFIEMEKEIAYLRNYIDLQKLRTQASPEIVIADNIGEKACDHQIAPMLLIPFVENAFKHGISLKERSWITINLECTADSILFEVRNSIHSKTGDDPERSKSGIGFKNVQERLKLMYNNRFELSVNDNGKEFHVWLSIKIK